MPPAQLASSINHSVEPEGMSSLRSQSININEEASVSYWLNALDCSEFELRVAVAEVGSASLDVGSKLGRVL